jgi:hypothetical protein
MLSGVVITPEILYSAIGIWQVIKACNPTGLLLKPSV